MGMDVFGTAPTTERGEYFRNNVWWWRPLWNYCIEVAPELTSEVSGEYNDGDGLNAEGAIALSNILFEKIGRGHTAQYQKDYYAEIADLPREDCKHCNSTGIRTDEVGVSAGQPDRALSPEVAILVGREFGWCNGCDGVGSKENWAASYPFDVQNVREFAEFLAESGGFSIC